MDLVRERRRVVIDTDVAIGIPERDVDDALAIVMALNSPELEVCGITLTFGNDSLDNVAQSMSELDGVVGLSTIDVARGAGSAADFGKRTEATFLLEDAAKGGSLTVLCLGPVTNLATFIEAHGGYAKQIIDEVVIVAGRRHGQRFRTGNFGKSHPDLNFEKDPAAMETLLKSGVKLVFAPFEVSSKVWITGRILDLIERNGTRTARYLAENSRPWLEFWKRTFSTELLAVDGFNPFDCLAVAWLTDRDLLSWEKAGMRIEEGDYDAADGAVQGKIGWKSYLHAGPCRECLGSKQMYIHDVEREAFLQRLIARLK